MAAGRALDDGISRDSCSENLIFSAENDIAIDDGYTLFNVVGYSLYDRGNSEVGGGVGKRKNTRRYLDVNCGNISYRAVNGRIGAVSGV